MAEVPTVPPPSSKTGLSRAKNDLAFLARGEAAAIKNSSLMRRSTLTSLRYVLKFAFWRLIRYGKYAVIAAGAAALAGTFAGAALPWVGALIVPSVPVAAAIGLTTSVIKFTWHHRGNHFRQGWLAGGEGRDARRDEARDANEAEAAFNRPTVHPRAEKAFGTEAF